MDKRRFIERSREERKIRAELGVAQIRDKVKDSRLRWFGHVNIKIAHEMEVIGKRSRGRQ